MKLKTDPLKNRIAFIRSDLRRHLIFILLSFTILLLFPRLRLLISSDTFHLPIQNLAMLGILSVSAFVISFAVQIKNSWRPDYQQNLKAAVLFSFYLFFINALIEEFFFRLILLSLLKSLTNQPLFSVMVTALIFGFYHVPLFGWDRTQAVLATIAGFCFGCVYLFTGSFIITWFVHGFADLGFIHESIGGYIVWTKIRYRELTDD